MEALPPYGENDIKLSMSIRKIRFSTDEFYHIYNRGIDRRVIFEDSQDFFKFLQIIDLFNQENSLGGVPQYKYSKKIKNGGKASMLVEVVAFCLLPNHFHFILRQNIEGGISKFMQKIGTGYTMYFNKKNKRNGSLFQGKFKAKHIGTQEYLNRLSVYVNLNFKVHKIKRDESGRNNKYRTSLPEYIKNMKTNLCTTGYILDSFTRDKKEYEQFANRQLRGILKNKEILKNSFE